MSKHTSPQPAAEPKPPEVKRPEAAFDEKQLDKVNGGAGNLYNACATGKHIPKGTITG